MTKNIVKEVLIAILFIIALAILFAIIFYNYMPYNKTVPVKMQAYTLGEDIKQEISNANSGEQNIVKTYYIDNSELSLYESTNNYDKGKANPFANYDEENTNTVTNNIKSNNIEVGSGNSISSESKDNGTNQNNLSETVVKEITIRSGDGSNAVTTRGNSNNNSAATENTETRQNEVFITSPGKNY